MPRRRPIPPARDRAVSTAWIGVVLAGVLWLGCAGSGPSSETLAADGPLAGAPDWILGPCDAHWDDDDPRLCATGSVAGTRNISLARTAAIGRARTVISQTLQERVEAMLEDYAGSLDDPDSFGTGGERSRYIEDVSKQITQLTMSGSTLQDTWVGPDGTLYTLVALDVDGFQNALDQMSSLSEPIREAVKARADASFRATDEAAD